MKKVIIATNNKGKIKELKKILNQYEILSIKDIEKVINKEVKITENYNTYEGNALSKVRCLYNYLKDESILIGDDSGLSIEALNGFPGVHTKRWNSGSDHDKNLLILEKMKNEENRKCQYTTAIAIKIKDTEKVFTSSLDGEISDKPKGNKGFGFDEIFKLKNGKTLAEINISEKLKISPRQEALEKAKEYIDNCLK